VDGEILRATTRGGRAARLALIASVPAVLLAAGLWPCPFAALTGLPCPGCGLTRAALAMLRGDLGAALSLHPLSPLVVPLALGASAWAGLDYVKTGRSPIGEPVRARVIAAGATLFALLIGVWVARFCGAFGGPVAVSVPSEVDVVGRIVRQVL
jgi:hypothetical protein